MGNPRAARVVIEHQAVGQVAGGTLALVQFVKDRGDRPDASKRTTSRSFSICSVVAASCGRRWRQGRAQHGIAQRRRLDVVPRIAELPLFALPN